MSLIPASTLELVGRPISDPIEFRIEAAESQRYAYAVGDENPLYFDDAAAEAAGFRALLSPPTFVSHARVKPRPQADLREDGLYQFSDGVRLNVERIMFGGEEWDFIEPVCVGDVIRSQTHLADLDEKQGSKGPFVRVVRENTYTRLGGPGLPPDSAPAVVARSRQIGIAR